MGAKMEPQGAQNHKKTRKASTQKNIKNTLLQKVGYWLHFGLKKGLLFRGRSAPKIMTIPKIFKMNLRPPKLQKIMILTSQNLENPIANLLKNGTVAGYARSAPRSALDNTDWL